MSHLQDFLLSQVERGDRLQFVHCLRPHSLAAADPSAAAPHAPEEVMDVSVVRQQMRSYLLIDSVRAANRGYPERMAFRDFRRRFQCLVREGGSAPSAAGSLGDALDDRAAVKRILESMQIYEHRYRLGISQVSGAGRQALLFYLVLNQKKHNRRN